MNPVSSSPLGRLPAVQPYSSRDNTEDNQAKLRETFNDFVGQTFYGQMLASMRKTVGEPAYFHGGRAEEVFQGQLDQLLAEKLSDSTADRFTGPMFEIFQLERR